MEVIEEYINGNLATFDIITSYIKKRSEIEETYAKSIQKMIKSIREETLQKHKKKEADRNAR